MIAPILLPEKHLLKTVKIFDKRYHEVSLATPEEFDKVLLEQKGLLNVKQKAGCLSHREDPVGFRSLTAQVLTQDTSFHWSLTASSALYPCSQVSQAYLVSPKPLFKINCKGTNVWRYSAPYSTNALATKSWISYPSGSALFNCNGN